jgi:hypothetical protein
MMVFEQQPRESDKAFAAFSLYLGMGPQRSLASVAAKVGKSLRLMEKWSRRFGWPSRVAAHGAHFAAVEREAAEALTRMKGVDWVKRQEEQRAAEWQARCELLELAQEVLKRWRSKPEKCGTLEGLARLHDLASKLGRLATGMPTDRTEVTNEVHTTIDLEWEIALKRVYTKADVRPPNDAPVIDVEAIPAADGGKEASHGA